MASATAPQASAARSWTWPRRRRPRESGQRAAARAARRNSRRTPWPTTPVAHEDHDGGAPEEFGAARRVQKARPSMATAKAPIRRKAAAAVGAAAAADAATAIATARAAAASVQSATAMARSPIPALQRAVADLDQRAGRDFDTACESQPYVRRRPYAAALLQRRAARRRAAADSLGRDRRSRRAGARPSAKPAPIGAASGVAAAGQHRTPPTPVVVRARQPNAAAPKRGWWGKRLLGDKD